MSHKLNGTPKIIIALNGLKLHIQLSEIANDSKCPVLKYEVYMHENDLIR